MAVFNQALNTKLYRAFNPPCLLQSSTPLFRLLTAGTNASTTDYLSKSDKIAGSSILNHRLQKNLPPVDYRILKIHFQQSDIPTALLVTEPLLDTILKQSRILPHRCDRLFANLCAVSAAWHQNLMGTSKWGPASRYCQPMTASRRKRRITQTMETMKTEAMTKAEQVLNAGT